MKNKKPIFDIKMCKDTNLNSEKYKLQLSFYEKILKENEKVQKNG